MINWVPKKEINQNLINFYIQKSISKNQFTNGGPCVFILEEVIKKKFKIRESKSVICVNNGTSALHSLVLGIELFNKKKFNWATQSFTFPPSAQGPLSEVEIIDIDQGGGLDLEKIPQDIQGIIVTNIFGNVVDIKKYEDYCQKNNLFLLFDNAATPYTFYY